MLRLSALLLVCLVTPTDLTAQTEADRASVNKVMERLFNTAGQADDEVARHPGTWSVVIAKFTKGDSRAIEIPAKVGERYHVIGSSESYETDVDICAYDPEGDQLMCDTEEDNFPVVTFSARTEGVYRAVMTAASVEGGKSFAGMVVLRIGANGEKEGEATRDAESVLAAAAVDESPDRSTKMIERNLTH